MSNLEDFARDELQRAGWFDADSDYGGDVGEAIMKMVKVFSDEGHSGGSAGLVVDIFKRVAMFEPLTPLTGEDDEWGEVGGGLYQNHRCSHVFKDATRVYDIQGRVFIDSHGCAFTNSDSHVTITFPYTPKTEYVHINR